MMKVNNFVMFNAFEKNLHVTSKKDGNSFSLSKVAPADDDDNSSTASASTMSSLSSVTMSNCASWDSDESDDEEYTTKSYSPLTSTVSRPERKCAKPSSESSTKSFPLYPRSESTEPVTISSLEADLQSLTKRYGKNHPLVARTWNLIGDAHFRNLEFRRALAIYKEAVLCGEPGVHLADAYLNLGRVYFALGNVQESIDFLERSLQTHEFFAVKLGRDLRTSKEVAAVRLQLNIALTTQGSPKPATEALALAREINVCADCDEELARAMNVMGARCHQQSDQQGR